MNLKYVVVIAIGIASSSQLGAQQMATLGVTRHSVAGPGISGIGDEPATVDVSAVTFRALSSASIAITSAYLLANVGASMEGPCSCDDPGLEGAVLGVLTGIVIGAPLGAAAPSMGSVCTFNQRFARSLVGSLAGTAAGILVLAATPGGPGLLAVPALAAGGSVVSLGRCLNSRGG